jgi:hypothetical protein
MNSDEHIHRKIPSVAQGLPPSPTLRVASYAL